MSFWNTDVLVRGRSVWDRLQMPKEEFQERTDRVREFMTNKGLDGLLIYADSLNNGSVGYLTNYHCYVTWSNAILVFPRLGEPILFISQPNRDIPRIKEFTYNSIEIEPIGLSLTVNKEIGKKTVTYLEKNGIDIKTWGGVGLGKLPSESFKAIHAGLRNIVDVTGDYNLMRIRKSPRELSIIQQAAQMAKIAALEFVRILAPGITEYQATAAVDRKLRLSGAEDIILLVGSSKDNLLHRAYNYTYNKGNLVRVFTAVKYLRYWATFGTSAVMGNCTMRQKQIYKQLHELENSVLKQIVSNRKLRLDWLNSIDLTDDCRISELSYLSGIGLDLEEDPCFQLDDREIEIANYMPISLCLSIKGKGGDTFFRSSTIVTQEEGLQLLTGSHLPTLPINHNF